MLATGALLAVFDLAARPWATIAVLAGEVAAFVWALRRLGTAEVSRSRVLVVAALLRVLLLPLPPSLSDDVYRYRWDGRIAAFGWNPYFHAPRDPELWDLRDELWERVAHREVETVYPPLALAAFSIASRLPWPLLAWKAMLVAIDLLSCLLLLRLARARAVPSGRTIAYAWNPLVVLEAAGMGHVDALGVLPLLVAATFLVEPKGKDAAIARRRAAAAGAALALAILAKLVPVLLLPAWAKASARRALFVVVCLAVVVLAAAPFAIGAPGAPPGLVTYAVSWEWNGPLFEPLWRVLDRIGAVPWTKARLDDLEAMTGWETTWYPLYHYVYPQLLAKVCLAIAMAGVVFASLRRSDPIEAALLVLGGVLLLSATVYPWYALWMLPLAALQWSVPWLVLSLSLLASYLPRLLDVPLLPWPFLMVWGPFALALVMRLRRRAPASASARPIA